MGYTLRMLKQEAIKLAGSQAKLAKLLGITRGAVWLWGEDVPVMRIYQLKVLCPQWFKNETPSAIKSLVHGYHRPDPQATACWIAVETARI